jgi:hypothetical protein
VNRLLSIGTTLAPGSRLLVACAAALALCVLLSPIAPCIDWPQHLALSAVLGRLWRGEAGAGAVFALNGATHNAGAHFFVAALGGLIGVRAAGAVFLALYPPLLLLGVWRLLVQQGLPGARALLVVPAALGFSFGWGFGNFCMASALSWLLLAPLLSQVERLTARRALVLAVGSLVVGATHVMAMLLLCVTAASAGAERAVRLHLRARAEGRAGASGGLAVGRLLAAGAPLLAGCAWDLRVLFAHLAQDSASYSTPQAAAAFDEPGLLRKAALFGSLLSGLFTTYADSAVAWMAVALLLVAAAVAVREGGDVASPGAPLRLPLAALGAFYLLVPSVFANTHLVFQRAAQWVLCAALLALPALRPAREAWLARAAGALAALYAFALLPLHLGVHAAESRRAIEVIAAVPRGASVVGVIEEPRSLAIRMPIYTHVAALAVAGGAAEDGFSFARWMGLPVIYRPGRAPPYPTPSWEHDGARYDARSALARRFPWVLVRTAWASEPDGNLSLRLFGEPCDGAHIRLVSRRGGWALFDTTRLKSGLQH